MPQNWQGPSRGRATRYPHPHQKPAGAGAWPITAGRPEEEAADRDGQDKAGELPRGAGGGTLPSPQQHTPPRPGGGQLAPCRTLSCLPDSRLSPLGASAQALSKKGQAGFICPKLPYAQAPWHCRADALGPRVCLRRLTLAFRGCRLWIQGEPSR